MTNILRHFLMPKNNHTHPCLHQGAPPTPTVLEWHSRAQSHFQFLFQLQFLLHTLFASTETCFFPQMHFIIHCLQWNWRRGMWPKLRSQPFFRTDTRTWRLPDARAVTAMEKPENKLNMGAGRERKGWEYALRGIGWTLGSLLGLLCCWDNKFPFSPNLSLRRVGRRVSQGTGHTPAPLCSSSAQIITCLAYLLSPLALYLHCLTLPWGVLFVYMLHPARKLGPSGGPGGSRPDYMALIRGSGWWGIGHGLLWDQAGRGKKGW